jgi:hypothetical protein
MDFNSKNLKNNYTTPILLFLMTFVRTYKIKVCEYEPMPLWGLFYKTFYGRNLRISKVSQTFCHWQDFPA